MSKIIRAICVIMLLSASAFAGPWLGLIYKKSLYENHLALLVSGVHPESVWQLVLFRAIWLSVLMARIWSTWRRCKMS